MARQGIERQRGERRHPTRPHQQRYNQTRSQERVAALVAANFPEGATVVTLSCNGAGGSCEPWRAVLRVRDIIYTLRKSTIPALHYVWGRVSNSDTLNYQIITDSPHIALCRIVELWGCGEVTIEQVQGESLIQTVRRWIDTTGTRSDGKRQWTPSLNLKKPLKETSV